MCLCLECARLVRACLGGTAVAAKKLLSGNPLVVLGIEMSLGLSGVTLCPSSEKINKWLLRIEMALDTGHLSGGDASHLSGALQWASHAMFKRLGRAMLRPIIRQIVSKDGRICLQLRLALEWWLEVLQLRLVQQRSWRGSVAKPVHLFCDARSTPPRLAAVLFIDGGIFYCDDAPSAELLASFFGSGDRHIMSLELASIALGISTFAEEIRGRNVVVWSDNKGAEGAATKGMFRLRLAAAFVFACAVFSRCRRGEEIRSEFLGSLHLEAPG